MDRRVKKLAILYIFSRFAGEVKVRHFPDLRLMQSMERIP